MLNNLRPIVDDILSKTDIVAVISSYIPVTKKGRNFVAVCPFHDDHHPSMQISQEKQIFKCFSCGASGNAISFVERYEKISFMAALFKVAEIMGISDPRLRKEDFTPRIDERTASLYACINDLERYYQYGLSTPEAEKARDYLAKRGITQNDIQKYGIGYSLLDGAKTVEYLRQRKHSVKSIEDIGIASASAKGMSDNNAGRLVFPLRNANGQVVGFSARRLQDDGSPKYVNSPETPIFKKGKVLYNYDLARQTAKRAGYIYLLEGFMDVMALGRAGIENAIALMGTSLTSEQIAMLRQLSVEIRICLDGDAPGQEGMMKIISQLNKALLPFRLVSNPGDLRDPDDIYQEEGKEALVQKMNNLVDPFSFQVDYYTNVRKLVTPEERLKVMHYFIPQLRNIPSGLERENTIIKLAKATGYEEEAIRKEINKAEPGQKTEEEIEYGEEVEATALHPERRFRKRLFKAERETLYYMLTHPEAIEFFKKNIDNFMTKNYNEIANYIIDYSRSRSDVVSLPLLVSDIESNEEEENKDGLIATLNEVAEDRYHPEFSLEALKTCASAIEEEKSRAAEDMLIKTDLEGKDVAEQAALLKEYAKKKRSRLKKSSTKKEGGN